MPTITGDTKIPVPTIRHFADELDSLAYALEPEEREDTWEKFEKAIIRFTAVTRGGGYQFTESYVEGVGRGGVGSKIVRCMLSDRGRLSGVAIELLQTFAPQLGLHFKPLVNLYLEPLVDLLGRPNKVFLKRAEKCLAVIISNCQIPTILTSLYRGLDDNAASCRKGCSMGVERALKEWPVELWTEKWLVILEESLKKMATNKDPDVRKAGKNVWALFMDAWPERVDEFSAPLTPTIKRYLDISGAGGLSKSKPTCPVPPARKVLPPLTSSTTSDCNKTLQSRVNDLLSVPRAAHASSSASVTEADPSGKRSSHTEPTMSHEPHCISKAYHEYSRQERSRALETVPLVSVHAHAPSGAFLHDVPPSSNPSAFFSPPVRPEHHTQQVKPKALSKPVRPTMPTSFSVPALHANPYSYVSSSSSGRADEPVRPRRLGQAQRIKVTLPVEGEEGDQEREQREYGRGRDKEGPLRGAVRPITAGMGGLGKKAGLGRAERRVVTTPLPTACGPLTTGAFEGGAVRLRKKEHNIAVTGEEQAECGSATHAYLPPQEGSAPEAGPRIHHPQPETKQQQQPFFSPVVAHVLKKNVDSPLLPVLMGSHSRSPSSSSTPSLENQLPPTTSTPSIAHPSTYVLESASPLEQKNVSEAEAQEEVYPLTPPSVKPSSKKKEEIELAKRVELPGSPKKRVEEDGQKEEREDKDGSEGKEKGQERAPASISTSTTASVPAPASNTTTSGPVPPPPPASIINAPHSRKPPIPTAASSCPMNPRPRVISGPSVSTKSMNKPPTKPPTKPIVRKAFRPTSSTSSTSAAAATAAVSASGSGGGHLTAATMAGCAKVVATNPSKPVIVTSSMNVSASNTGVGGAAASSTAGRTAKAQYNTAFSSTKSLAKVKEKEKERTKQEPVRRAEAKKAATIVPALSRQASTSSIAAVSTLANGRANAMPGRKPPVPSHVTLPPAKKERIKLKMPLPSFRPARARPAVAAQFSTSGAEVKGQRVRGKEMRQEMIRLPDSPPPGGNRSNIKGMGLGVKETTRIVKREEVPWPADPHEMALPKAPQESLSPISAETALKLKENKEKEREGDKSPTFSSTRSARLITLEEMPQSPIKLEKGRPASPLLTTGVEAVYPLLESGAGFEDRELRDGDEIKVNNRMVAGNENEGEEEITIEEADEREQKDERKQDQMGEHLMQENEIDISSAPPSDAYSPIHEPSATSGVPPRPSSPSLPTQIHTPSPASTSSTLSTATPHLPTHTSSTSRYTLATCNEASAPYNSAITLLSKLESEMLIVESGDVQSFSMSVGDEGILVTPERRALAVKDVNTVQTNSVKQGDKGKGERLGTPEMGLEGDV
ncbi:hypothetical protein I312_104686 [Cryptococcus bacillisporus CA1280]|uniref:uncharacterized protein n=1 Tax=Cryptococcus bacillisporus CA1280 TaxID=1296109 RepID=UPI003365BE89